MVIDVSVIVLVVTDWTVVTTSYEKSDHAFGRFTPRACARGN